VDTTAKASAFPAFEMAVVSIAGLHGTISTGKKVVWVFAPPPFFLFCFFSFFPLLFNYILSLAQNTWEEFLLK